MSQDTQIALGVAGVVLVGAVLLAWRANRQQGAPKPNLPNEIEAEETIAGIPISQIFPD